MKTVEEKRISAVRRWFRLCPVRHVLTLLGLAVIATYFALRSSRDVMQAISDGFVRPWHRTVSRLCAHVSFSVAELLIALAVILALVYLVYSVVQLIRRIRVIGKKELDISFTYEDEFQRALSLVLAVECRQRKAG